MSDILIVDDERDIRELVAEILKDDGYQTRLAANSDEAMAAVQSAPPMMMILDLWLKDSKLDGIGILMSVKREYPDIPIVIISGHGNIEIAVEAIKKGAYDFIEKPFNIDQLLAVIGRAMETSRLRRENVRLRRKDPGPTEMIGQSPAMKALRTQLAKVTRSNGRVMLTGPSGSGKEVAARFIHAQSNRAQEPFVTVSCAAIAPDSMEAVLFGQEIAGRGVSPGLLEQANNGVLYLDEVADMPPGTQSKILRVLVDQSFTRVGGTERQRVDIRVISSTTRDLKAEIAAGTFRRELYDRLNVVSIAVPSLEERREDIPTLARHFIEVLHTTQGLPRRDLTVDAEAQLQGMSWPGNIRQLRNVIERALILGEGPSIEVRDLAAEAGATPEEGRVVLSGSLATLPLREARELFEREYLLTQIVRFGGNISRTAAFVGMERSALHRKLKSLGVQSADVPGGRGGRDEDGGGV